MLIAGKPTQPKERGRNRVELYDDTGVAPNHLAARRQDHGRIRRSGVQPEEEQVADRHHGQGDGDDARGAEAVDELVGEDR